jgi:hypothetical protein
VGKPGDGPLDFPKSLSLVFGSACHDMLAMEKATPKVLAELGLEK